MNFNLRRFREAANFTQQELADKIGKSFRTVQSWERGVSYPNAKSLCDLCNLFGVDPDTLLGWEGRLREDAPPPTPDESGLLADYRACTPEWRRNIRMTAIAAHRESFRESERPSSDAVAADGA